MSKIIPEPYTICHIARRLDETFTDSHGNHPVKDLDPVIRKAQSLHQGSAYPRSREIVGEEYLDRIDTMIFMAVNDPTLYAAGDQVLLFGTVDEQGEYQDGTAYWVDGTPTDDRNGPWRKYYKPFGGVVSLRRVT